MSYAYSENTLIQESAGNLLQNELGWQVEYAYNKEVPGADGTFSRRDYHEVSKALLGDHSIKELLKDYIKTHQNQ